MKAKDYVTKFKRDFKTIDEVLPTLALIWQRLTEEANELAVLRKCQGGKNSDSTFGTYCACFAEQHRKWLAICERWPEIKPWALAGFADFLNKEYKQVYTILHSQGEFTSIDIISNLQGELS